MTRWMMVAKTMAVFAMLAVVAMMAAGEIFAGEGKGKDESGESFDWLQATNGRGVFRDGFATADPEQLTGGFAVTGINAQTIILTLEDGGYRAEYRAILRGGRYYSNEENPDDSMDIPASAVVLDDGGRLLFAAKGYKFMGARAEDNAIIVRYWNGTMGCNLTDYHLRPTNTNMTISNTNQTIATLTIANLTIAKAQIISTKDYTPCPAE